MAVTEGNSEALISDKWGLKATRMALIVHIKGKQLVRFLAVDAFMHSAHCTPHVTLRCEGGCRAFLLQRELKLLAHVCLGTLLKTADGAARIWATLTDIERDYVSRQVQGLDLEHAK